MGVGNSIRTEVSTQKNETEVYAQYRPDDAQAYNEALLAHIQAHVPQTRRSSVGYDYHYRDFGDEYRSFREIRSKSPDVEAADFATSEDQTFTYPTLSRAGKLVMRTIPVTPMGGASDHEG